RKILDNIPMYTVDMHNNMLYEENYQKLRGDIDRWLGAVQLDKTLTFHICLKLFFLLSLIYSVNTYNNTIIIQLDFPLNYIARSNLYFLENKTQNYTKYKLYWIYDDGSFILINDRYTDCK
ncbi:hypothetical protein ACJX0J_032661, partial [Zea mays]